MHKLTLRKFSARRTRLTQSQRNELFIYEFHNNTLHKKVWLLKDQDSEISLTVDASSEEIAWLKLFDMLGIRKENAERSHYTLELHQVLQSEADRIFFPGVLVVQ